MEIRNVAFATNTNKHVLVIKWLKLKTYNNEKAHYQLNKIKKKKKWQYETKS